MQLLVLGGTVFLGRHAVAAALAAGHEVTLLHRGRSGADLFPDCEHLIGDRDGDLSALAGRRFDAVLDTCGYTPAQVGASLDVLADACEHYTFVSSVSVYADPRPGDDESAALAALPADHDGSLDGASYGPLKALAEQVLRERLGERACVVRPGLIVGPHDPTDRFTWWPRRLAAGGRSLAPSPAEAPVQLIDGRDLGAWLVRLAEARTPGTFNAVGDDRPLTRGDLVGACRAAADDPAEVTWIDEAWLVDQGVQPWMELPLWIPAGSDGMLAVSGARAVAAGLTCRPLAATCAETLAWDRSRPADREPVRSSFTGQPLQIGLAPDREAALLAAWHGR